MISFTQWYTIVGANIAKRPANLLCKKGSTEAEAQKHWYHHITLMLASCEMILCQNTKKGIPKHFATVGMEQDAP